MTWDISSINQQLKNKSPLDIIQWAMTQNKPTIATTSFSPNAAALLHLLVQVAPNIPIIWIDSGYNVADTYRTAEQIITLLHLNIQIYTPTITAERRNAVWGGIPHPDENPEIHQTFTQEVKLEPFERALADYKPELWIAGIRRDETDFRKNLDIISLDQRGILKVAPLFYWSQNMLQAYKEKHQLPSCQHYFDPTKVADNRECGLHTSA